MKAIQKVEYIEGKEFIFFTHKHTVSDTNKIITIVLDNSKTEHKILGELPLNRRIKLVVKKVKKSGHLQLLKTGEFLLDKEESLRVKKIAVNPKTNLKFFELESDDKITYRVPLLTWQHSSLYAAPKIIRCVVDKENERIYVRQIIDDQNKHPLFGKGISYPFKFLRFDSKPGIIKYIIAQGEDGIEYKVKAQNGQEFEDLKGRKIECTFVDYSRSGELYLVQSEKFFLTISKVFKIQNEKQFLNNLDSECSSSITYQKFKEQYQQKDNRWLLSLSNSLYSLVDSYVKRGIYKEAIETINSYCQIERFILTSAYLGLYSSEVQNQLKNIGEAGISYFQSLIDPLNSLLNLNYEKYIDDFVEAKPSTEPLASIRSLQQILLLFKIAPQEYFDKPVQILEWFNKLGSRNYYVLDKGIAEGFFTWIYKRSQIIEKELLDKIFFNNDEKKKYYRSNEKLVKLINFYIVLYNITFTSKLTFNYKILLSKIIRCVILYKNEKNGSDLLSRICIDALYNKIQFSPQFIWSYYTSLEKIEQALKNQPLVISNDVQFLESKKDLFTNTPQVLPARILSKTKFGYTVAVDKHEGVLSSKSIFDYEVNFFFKNSKTFKPKVKLLAIDESGKKFLFDFIRKENTFFKKNIDAATLSVGDTIKGLVRNHTKSGSFVDIGGTSAFIHRRDTDWGPVSFMEDFLSIGEVYDFMIKEISPVQGNKLSIQLARKYSFADPYPQLKNKIYKEFYGRFLRFISLEYLTDYNNLDLNLNAKGTELASCPRCLHLRKIENRSLVVNKDEKRWYCTDTECGFQGEEILLFRIDDLHVTTAVKSRGSRENIVELLEALEPNDQIKLKMTFVDTRNRFVFSEVVNCDIKKNQNRTLSYKSETEDKELVLELARVYEDIASTQEKVREELNYLYWSQHYYGLGNHAKSYYYNIYISLLDILLELEKYLDSQTPEVDIIDTIASRALLFVNTIADSDKTVTSYAILKNHIEILKTLSLLKEEGLEINNRLFEVAFSQSNEVHLISKRVAKVILSYNILVGEMVDRTGIDKEWAAKIYSVLKQGLLEIREMKIDLSEKITSDNKRRLEEIMLKIYKGEGKNIEFKSSLYTPVLDKNRTAELSKFQTKLEEAKSIGDQKLQSEALKAIDALKNSSNEVKIKFAAMKEIAAFANSDGGTLIIGIDDEKKILGLENDFQRLKKADKNDEFKLKFDDMVKDYLGEFTFDLIKCEFITIEDKSIFVVEVEAIPKDGEPLWVNKNENGNLESLLFIRGESSARCLTGKDLANYIKRR